MTPLLSKFNAHMDRLPLVAIFRGLKPEEALDMSATALADEVTWTGLWALAQHLYPQDFKLS